jgi:hypothetical protein
MTALPSRPPLVFGLLLALAAPIVFMGAADARPSVVDRAFGNTIVSTYPDGRTGELWLNAGGAYTAKGRRGDPSRGHWSIKGDKLCLKQVKPVPMLISFCTPIPQAGLGTPWSAKAATGEAITVRVMKGHYSGGR